MSTITIVDAVPSRNEANRMLVDEFGWNSNSILIRDLDSEWGEFQRNWELGGKTLAFEKFILRRNNLAQGEVAAFKAKTSAFTPSAAAAYAKNWN